MPVYLLSPNQADEFARLPEAAMDIHLGHSGNALQIVIGCRVAVTYDVDSFRSLAQAQGDQLIDIRAVPNGTPEAYCTALGATQALPALQPLEEDDVRSAISFLRTTPVGGIAPTPPAPTPVFGHLPFKAMTRTSEKFYRYEAFPASRRVTRTGLSSGSYAAPASEDPFTPTGLSAVGRYALPSLLPACWRYEIEPPVGTTIHCGASVPLYGQSGGAVEVCFPAGFAGGTNTGPSVIPEF
ncbi:MAG: hypothetical protein QNJ15_14670 [Erythrobacter sp.]|nr:hypothetical protein [Erythrobacter sp.]